MTLHAMDGVQKPKTRPEKELRLTLFLTTFARASASANVSEAERPNGRVAEDRAARTCGGAFKNFGSCCKLALINDQRDL
jgi:hypothetical protein